jgi:hypothetical protein
MSSQLFPNGQTLISSAFTPPAFETLLQSVIAQILGFDPATEASDAFSAVRVGWQQTGQPAWEITDDVCTLLATPENDPYSQTREAQLVQNDPKSLVQNMSFTQVWKLHATIYGPNSYDHARLIVSAMALDWTHDLLAASNIYAVTEWDRPIYVPELFNGQWWQRTDLNLSFNELVSESIVIAAAASVEVTTESDTASGVVDIQS